MYFLLSDPKEPSSIRNVIFITQVPENLYLISILSPAPFW